LYYYHEPRKNGSSLEFIGERGTPMGNPANWFFLQMANEFFACLSRKVCEINLKGYKTLPDERFLPEYFILPDLRIRSDCNYGSVSCGDDALHIGRSRRMFRAYEYSITQFGGAIISRGSHFESLCAAIFTETPYSLSPRGDLWYIECVKLRMLVSPEFRFPGAKELPAEFLWGETFTKALDWLKWTPHQLETRKALLYWLVRREGDLMGIYPNWVFHHTYRDSLEDGGSRHRQTG